MFSYILNRHVGCWMFITGDFSGPQTHMVRKALPVCGNHDLLACLHLVGRRSVSQTRNKTPGLRQPSYHSPCEFDGDDLAVHHVPRNASRME